MDVVLFQKWSFFAPPPTYNTKLYYVFTNSNGIEKSYDALSIILNQKKKKAPFNTKEEYLDYVLSGSVINIMNIQSEYIDYFKSTMPDSTDQFQINSAMTKIHEEYEENYSYQTLEKYGHYVKAKNLPTDTILEFKFIIAGLFIPKFHDRFSQKSEEKMFFKSMNFKYKQTEN
jgi:hypothetical protein